MKIIRLKLIFIMIFSLSCFTKCSILNKKNGIILRKLSDPEDTPNDDYNFYEECSGSAYEPPDCYEIEYEFEEGENYKCCFMEYKDKGIDNKRKRACTVLTYDQFLDIKKTIKEIKKSNKNYTIFSLECDKSKFLSLKIFPILILLLINL